MKKNHFFAFALLGASFCVNAQNVTIDFESFVLPLDTFENNANQAYFDFESIKFSNAYDATFQYNTGFSVTNMKNDTVGDYTNSHSAITASGRNSENYLAFYGNGDIDLSQNSRIARGLYITNATYTYLSMKNGDSYGKKFGSPNGANGMLDGTNGEDFFRVIFQGVDANNTILDSVIFYLADFRFSDNSQDYIVDTWEFVDLFPLYSNGLVSKINILLESSDNDPMFGMNTPAYFAIDDFQYDYTVGVKELENSISFGPNPVLNSLNVNGEFDVLEIRDLQGRLVFKTENSINPKIDFTNIPNGTYLLSGRQDGKLVSTKIIK
ncbi:MAG: DUF4465 domain-containing protein [Bacteroidetes bacterium]|nr:DUF4465 domain-containing protein [Bacteroidota bacterium]